jgi:large subunit ribosomal protein L24
MAQHVRKGDLVQVIAGDAKGTQARVLRVLPKENRVVVEGVNVRTKHVKRSQQNPQGGTITKEMAIHASNVMPVVDGKPTRVRFETRKDGSKVRVAVKGGAQIGDELRKAR